MKVRINSKNAFVLIVMSFFVFGNQIRYGFNPILYQINILFLVGLVFLYIINWKQINKNNLIIWIICVFHMLIINIINNCTTMEIIRNFLIMYLPLLLFMLDLTKLKINFNQCVETLIKIFNFFTYLQLVIYFGDIILNGKIMGFIAKHLAPKMNDYLSVNGFSLFRYRFSSYLGQSLIISEVFVIYFIINIFYERKTSKRIANRFIVYGVAMIGALITASRTATVIILSLIVLEVLFEKHKFISITIVAIMIFLFEGIGIFNLLSQRMSAVTLTAGRNEAWELLKSANIQMHLFYGTGMKTFDEWSGIIGTSRAGNAYEYPMLTLLYRMGILHTLVWMHLFFLQPILKLWRNKSGWALIYIIALALQVNVNNGISELTDAVLLYEIAFSILIFTSCINNNSLQSPFLNNNMEQSYLANNGSEYVQKI